MAEKSADDEKMITLKSNDNQTFQVTTKVAMISYTIKTLLESCPADDEPVPLPKVDGYILGIIIEWAKHHQDDKPLTPEEEEEEEKERRTDNIPQFDQDMLNVSQRELYEIIMAANYLDIKGLLDSCCKTIANIIKGKTPEQLKLAFPPLDLETPLSSFIKKDQTIKSTISA